MNLYQGSDTRGQLDIKVSAIQAGSKSEFLPKVYKPLFNDKSLRRKSYFDFLKKKEASQEKMKAQAANLRRSRKREKRRRRSYMKCVAD